MTDDNKKPERYRLGGEFGDKYLTRQEARCMVCFLRGNAIKGTAKILDLSPRTVEYYVNNMKKKLGVVSKSELVFRVIETDFTKDNNIDPLTF